jgi:hypothetical protein
VVLPDVNVLVYAYREDAPRHREYHGWLERVVNGSEAYGLSTMVLSGFLRVVTHPRVFSPPSPIDDALSFVGALRQPPACVHVEPGPRHWGIFDRLCREANVKGNLVPDAFLAALAIESGSEWITADRGYGRFPGLRWRHPLASS